MFQNRKLVVATKHGKESVIAPLFESEFGIVCTLSEIDTDILGTFSGEIERKSDALSTARQKCLMAMQSAYCELAIASEGSFGPHPSIPFAHADDELLMFIDKKNELEIVVRELSLDTNFNATTITSIEALEDFARQVKFPSHALIIKKSENDWMDLEKGITTWEGLNAIGSDFLSKNGSLYVETDMRAHFNPTRMKVIERAAHKLVEKIKSICPDCHTPGFGISDSIKGLPCEWCKSATRSVLSHIYSCKKCNYSQEKKFPYGKFFEDPMYCDYCNP